MAAIGRAGGQARGRNRATSEAHGALPHPESQRARTAVPLSATASAAE
jgi:hypothetical protein